MAEMFWDGKFEWEDSVPRDNGRAFGSLDDYRDHYLPVPLPSIFDIPESIVVPRREAMGIRLTADGEPIDGIEALKLENLMPRVIRPDFN